MDINDLDRLFDESLGRMSKNTGPLTGAYAGSPLAADHALLQRSWEYFRQRLKDIDEHWKKVLQSKEAELAALQKDWLGGKDRIKALEEGESFHLAFEEELKKSKAEDLEKFKKDIESLRARWEDERDAFVRSQSKSDAQLREKERRLSASQEEWASREKRYIDLLEQLRKDASAQVQKHLENKNEWTVDLNSKGEEIKNLHLKGDVLRAEIDRRDQLIRELRENISTQQKESAKAASLQSELEGKLKDREDQISLLQKNMVILAKEKETVQELWAREQAEWRELWDRDRQNWERRNPSRNENVDIE